MVEMACEDHDRIAASTQVRAQSSASGRAPEQASGHVCIQHCTR